MQTARGDLFRWFVRLLVPLCFAAISLCYLAFSLHWKLAADASVMHYVIFLTRHGFQPYTQITDNNMPGAYLAEAIAMRVFGPGDLAWRVYEFSLLGTMTACMCFLARRIDWVAGFFASAVFIALHASEGPQLAAERELVVTVLLLLACVALSLSIERRSPRLMLATGAAGALAASIKPTFLPLALVLVLVASFVLHRRRVSPWPYVLWGIAGLSAVGALCLGFLMRIHALGSFVFILTKVLPAYAGMVAPSWGLVIHNAMPRSLFALLLATLPLAIRNWRRFGPWQWDRIVLTLGVLSGLLSYLAQHKGFPHHRYTFLVFLLTLIAMELFAALRDTLWFRVWATAAIFAILFGFVPAWLRSGARDPDETQLYTSLRSDLRTLGGTAQLQDKVFCFDLVYGCLNALYHENMVENMPFTGDLLFFPMRENPATTYYRERFWDAVRQDPPSVLVVSNESLMENNSFNRLQRWPQLEAYLSANYIEVAERAFAHEKFGVHQSTTLPPADQDAYRLYISKDSTLLKKAPLLASPQDPGTGAVR